MQFAFIEYNTRKKCKEILEQVKEHDPWFGIEQEFYITDKNDVPLDWALFNPSIGMHMKYVLYFMFFRYFYNSNDMIYRTFVSIASTILFSFITLITNEIYSCLNKDRQ